MKPPRNDREAQQDRVSRQRMIDEAMQHMLGIQDDGQSAMIIACVGPTGGCHLRGSDAEEAIERGCTRCEKIVIGPPGRA
jgi:hypothetical protein